MSRDVDSATMADAAAVLGDGWSVDYPDDDRWRCYLSGPDGARVFVCHDWRDDSKWEVSGAYPDGAYRDVYPSPARCEIRVSVSRGGAVLGREIARRLLPAYLPDLARVRVSLGRDADAATVRGTLAAQLAPMIDGSVDSDRPHSDKVRGIRWNHNDPRGWGNVDLGYDGSTCTVEIHSLSPDAVAAVLAALTDYTQGLAYAYDGRGE